MANVLYDDLESTIWTALCQAIVNEVNIGSGGAGTGTNPSGRLQTCADVRKSIHLFTGNLPAIGVQSLGYTPERMSTHADMLSVHFVIIAAANSKKQGATPANMDDANAKLQALVSDGAGSGLGPVLRDPANYALKATFTPPSGAFAISETWLSGLKRDWEIKDGEDAQIIAYAFFEYVVKIKAYIGL